ncbi:ribbon-helix-helix domain-containing protein [Mesorhizobium xinjiangense]|uniref:ribbon-helix-helix domain-containing protein n=1 Tax=Mesorhizobium xinjiangense TaxID=2678685 RepID=UPI0012EE3C6F|nr:type II toxin-antitoxin system ParD family antitoxin [Mesorhizobium xinjiangense]
MGKVEKVSVAITAEMAATVRDVVESGEYASASEVMRDALRGWKLRRAERAQAMTEIGRLWDEGIASGPARDGEERFSAIKQRLEAAPPSDS